MQKLLSRLRSWVGFSDSVHADNAQNCDRSKVMSAMPHAQMEHVFESLTPAKKSPSSQGNGLQPQWRLVSRDGSTSSVDSVSDTKKHNCPDCLAGRCGEKHQGCQCSKFEDKPTISLDRLTGKPPANAAPPLSAGSSTAAMPPASPQLFDAPASETPRSTVDLESEISAPQAVTAGSTLSLSVASTMDQPVANEHRSGDSSGPQPPAEELQKVIDHWPRLPITSRRAILAIVGALNEADSA